MKWAAIYLLPAVAAQALAPLAFRWIYTARYESRMLSPGSEELFTVLALAVAAAAGFLLGGRAAYLLTLHCRVLVAGPILLLVCFPTFLSASVYLYASLIFRGWA